MRSILLFIALLAFCMLLSAYAAQPGTPPSPAAEIASAKR